MSDPITLLGRDTECARLRALVADVQSGSCATLVLRGEAGVGKTALLQYLWDQTASFTRIRLAGVESDMELAFAGLQQLCAPLLSHLDDLPPPQREALDVAFGRGVGATPDRFLVGLAVLSLLAAAAARQPLLCIVDDAQWLDLVTVQTLGFVARRLLAEPVALVFAVRDRPDVLAGLPDLDVRGLPDSDARRLLDSVMVGGIDPRVRDRIVAETRGLPLALVEVPRTVSPTELAGGFWISGKRSSTAAIEDDFVHRIRALPPDTRRLLLLAAAEPVGDAALFLTAAGLLGIGVEALGPAESAGILGFGSTMRFGHPLMRSAAYRAAEFDDRRDIHRALAEATDARLDPDRRAWHAALAAAGPDDAVAAELAASASRAQSRGGVAAAASFLERAAVLTADPAARGARAIAAAQAQREAAAPEKAHAMLAIAESAPLTPVQRAQVARIRAQMEFVRSRAGVAGALSIGESASLLLAAATELDDLDGDLARDTYLEALIAAMYAGRLGAPGLIADIAQAARAALDRLPELDRPADLLLSGLADRLVDGPGAGSAHLRAALTQWDGDEWPYPIAQESGAHELWDDGVLKRSAADMVQRARATGALAVLPPALTYLAGTHVYTGELTAAAELLDEASAKSAAIGNMPARYHTFTLAAWRGTGALDVIAGAAADGTAKGEGRLVAVSSYTTAVLCNGLGRYDEAYAAARECCAYEDLGLYSWCLFELIEAATHLGKSEDAAEALRRFEQRPGRSGTDWGLGAVAAARALVAGGSTPDTTSHNKMAADALFAEAIERLHRAGIVLHLARTRLSYGEWLRRTRRRTDARRQLGAAHEAFTRMGAHGFAERARRELLATGEKVRKHAVGSGDALTAQEGQIARLAAAGLTNQEIAAQLFISAHTVEWHLRKVFVKLGVTSRRQLRTRSFDG
jgi:DNA-binding CsgD family transcriptional regulator